MQLLMIVCIIKVLEIYVHLRNVWTVGNSRVHSTLVRPHLWEITLGMLLLLLYGLRSSEYTIFIC